MHARKVAAVAALALMAGSINAQTLFQRIGAAAKAGAGAVMGKPAGLSNSDNPSGVAVTTTGDYFRPINPSHGGEFRGLYDSWHQGSAWPRASVFFTQYGSQLPCWTARAVIWRSMTLHREETFQVCNAPIVTHDDMGNAAQVGGPAEQMSQMLTITRNIQGITHADTSPTRNAGPNPPAMPFNVSIAGLEGTRIRPMYNAVIIRLAWVSGYIAPGDTEVNNSPGKSLWIAGFDPNGNHDKGMP